MRLATGSLIPRPHDLKIRLDVIVFPMKQKRSLGVDS